MRDVGIRGKVILITGAARGIGRATASVLADAGGRVAICDIDGDFARQTASELAVEGADVRAYALDVTSREDFDVVAGRVERDLGPIDVLINNAGMMALGSFLEHDERLDRRQLDLNFFGVVHGMRALLPRMMARRAGHIINVASIAGLIATPQAAIYSATKHAVIGVTESVRAETWGSGVILSYVMPALVNTELISGAGRPKWPPVTEPSDVARAIRDAIERGTVEVYVPRATRIAKILPAFLPRGVLDWVGLNLGVGEMFALVDRGKRAAYIARTSANPPRSE